MFIKLFCVLGFVSYVVAASRIRHMAKQIVSYQQCQWDNDCIDNAICVNNTLERPGFCACRPGYLLEKNRTSYECLKEASILGDACTKDVQCQIKFATDSECRDRKCACKTNAHFYVGECWRTVGLGDLCHFSEECLLKGNKVAYCVSGRCSCDASYHPVKSPNGDDCVRTVKLGEPCSDDEECNIIQNSRCFGTCHCKLGYIPNYGDTQCLPLANYVRDPCREDRQCEILEHTVCRNQSCQCEKQYHDKNNLCYRSAKLNEECSKTEECEINRNYENLVECHQGICVCKEGTCSGKNAAPKKVALVYMSILTFLIVY